MCGPLEYAPATVSRHLRPKVTTLPRKTHGSKSAPLPPEPSRPRPCNGFAGLETKSDDPSTQNRSKSTRRYRQSPLEYALGKVSRPPRPKVTTIPRKIHGSKSGRGYRQSPLEHARATVSGPSRPKVTTIPRKSNAPATVSRPSRPKLTTIPRKTRGSKSARRYRQSPLEYVAAKVSRHSRPKVTTLPRRSKARAATSTAR